MLKPPKTKQVLTAHFIVHVCTFIIFSCKGRTRGHCRAAAQHTQRTWNLKKITRDLNYSHPGSYWINITGTNMNLVNNSRRTLIYMIRETFVITTKLMRKEGKWKEKEKERLKKNQEISVEHWYTPLKDNPLEDEAFLNRNFPHLARVVCFHMTAIREVAKKTLKGMKNSRWWCRALRLQCMSCVVSWLLQHGLWWMMITEEPHKELHAVKYLGRFGLASSTTLHVRVYSTCRKKSCQRKKSTEKVEGDQSVSSHVEAALDQDQEVPGAWTFTEQIWSEDCSCHL